MPDIVLSERAAGQPAHADVAGGHARARCLPRASSTSSRGWSRATPLEIGLADASGYVIDHVVLCGTDPPGDDPQVCDGPLTLGLVHQRRHPVEREVLRALRGDRRNHPRVPVRAATTSSSSPSIATREQFSERDLAMLRMISPALQRLMRTHPTPALPASLTMTERRVLQLLATGRSNADIAADLYVSVATVRKHLEHAYRKLGVTQPDGRRDRLGSSQHRVGRARRAGREIRLTANTARRDGSLHSRGTPTRPTGIAHDLSSVAPSSRSAPALSSRRSSLSAQRSCHHSSQPRSGSPRSRPPRPPSRWQRIAIPDHLHRGRPAPPRRRALSRLHLARRVRRRARRAPARPGRGDRRGRHRRP